MIDTDIGFEMELEFNILKEFIPLIINSYEDKYRNINEKDFSWSNDPKLCSDYGNYLLKGVKNLSFQLAIISLNKYIEVTIKKIINNYFPTENTDNLYIGKMKEIFRQKMVFDANSYKGGNEKIKLEIKNLKNIKELEDIPNYDCYNEIRLISNSIKHDSVVSKQLAKLSLFWREKEGMNLDRVNELEDIYYKLLIPSNCFLRELFAYTKLSVNVKNQC